MKSAERDPVEVWDGAPQRVKEQLFVQKEVPYKRGAKFLAAITSPYFWLMGAARPPMLG